MYKPLKKSDLKRVRSKMDDSSNSNSDSSVDQEIHSYKHVDKPSRKKCAVDEDFWIKNTRIDAKTSKWLQKSSYQREYYKDGFS